MMTACQVGLIVATLGLAVAQILPIDEGSKLSQLGVAGLLGVVALGCVMGMVYLFRIVMRQHAEVQSTNKEHEAKFVELIEEGIKVSQKSADSIEGNIALMVEVKDAMLQCKAKQP